GPLFVSDNDGAPMLMPGAGSLKLVFTTALLFDRSVSASSFVVLAVLDPLAQTADVAVTVTVVASPAARPPIVHDTVPALWLQVPDVVVELTYVRPDSTSVSATFVAASGPLFVTPMV